MSETTAKTVKPRVPKPKWLRVKLPTEGIKRLGKLCLNISFTLSVKVDIAQTWVSAGGEGTATFMILGNVCTRSCGFCNVNTGKPEEVDVWEPAKVAKSVALMGVKHAVITSVDR